MPADRRRQPLASTTHDEVRFLCCVYRPRAHKFESELKINRFIAHEIFHSSRTHLPTYTHRPDRATSAQQAADLNHLGRFAGCWLAGGTS